MNSYSTSWWSLLLINRSREDERLSWPCWLTYSGWFTHIHGYPSVYWYVGRSSPCHRPLSSSTLRSQSHNITHSPPLDTTWYYQNGDRGTCVWATRLFLCNCKRSRVKPVTSKSPVWLDNHYTKHSSIQTRCDWLFSRILHFLITLSTNLWLFGLMVMHLFRST